MSPESGRAAADRGPLHLALRFGAADAVAEMVAADREMRVRAAWSPPLMVLSAVGAAAGLRPIGEALGVPFGLWAVVMAIGVAVVVDAVVVAVAAHRARRHRRVERHAWRSRVILEHFERGGRPGDLHVVADAVVDIEPELLARVGGEPGDLRARGDAA